MFLPINPGTPAKRPAYCKFTNVHQKFITTRLRVVPSVLMTWIVRWIFTTKPSLRLRDRFRNSQVFLHQWSIPKSIPSSRLQQPSRDHPIARSISSPSHTRRTVSEFALVFSSPADYYQTSSSTKVSLSIYSLVPHWAPKLSHVLLFFSLRLMFRMFCDL